MHTYIRLGNKIIVILALFSILINLLGCSSLIKRGIKEIKGADAFTTEIRPPDADKLRQYKYLLIDYKSIVGDRLPPDTIDLLYKYTKEKLLESPLLYELIDKDDLNKIKDRSTILIMRGIVIHYVSSDSLSKLLGKADHMIVRIELEDAATGKVIGISNQSVILESITRRGHEKLEELTEAIANSIKKWLSKSLFEKGKDES